LPESVEAGVGGAAAAEAVVDGLAALEAGFDGMPVLDGRFAALPAEQDDFAVDGAREVKQANVEILDLDADFVDFREGFPDTLNFLFQFGAPQGDFGDVDEHAAGDVDAAGEVGELFVDLLGSVLALEGAFEERLHQWEHGLSFV
jgi:hypothetical protein